LLSLPAFLEKNMDKKSIEQGPIVSGGVPDGLKEARANVDHERQSGQETTAVYGDVVDGTIPNQK